MGPHLFVGERRNTGRAERSQGSALVIPFVATEQKGWLMLERSPGHAGGVHDRLVRTETQLADLREQR